MDKNAKKKGRTKKPEFSKSIFFASTVYLSKSISERGRTDKFKKDDKA